jgi:hypothetical protein
VAAALIAALIVPSLRAATYVVDPRAANAADKNPGTAEAPWKTFARAAAAPELKPGDTVLIQSGLYREDVQVKVCGEPGRPIAFAAAPGARVVLKGSETVTGRWAKLADDKSVPEPHPKAFEGVWRIPLEERFFTDARFQGCYQDKARRWVSQVFLNDHKSLQRIGPDPLYRNEPDLQLATVGRGLADLVWDSFWFDPKEQMLYLKIGGEPSWFSIEVGVRAFVLTAQKVHDVVLRGFEMRHNRQPGGQWPMATIGECERVIIEDCQIAYADFCGLGVGRSKQCVVRRCDLSHNGNTGLGMGECEDCIVEDCTLLFNNTRRFFSGWHAGGMKCIPANRRCTIQRCEAAYNIASDGIWFDYGNADIRILSNVAHHNDGSGIFFEVNKGGGIIADNLVFANRGLGIYVAGSQHVWVVHNTVAGNLGGIYCMSRPPEFPLAHVEVRNNLLIRNWVPVDNHARSGEIAIDMGCPGDTLQRTLPDNHSDYNVFALAGAPPTLRHSWNPDHTLDQWRQRFGEDMHSALLPADFVLTGTSFRLLRAEGLDVAGPLPDTLPWKPAAPRRVGCARTQWP